MKEAFKAAVVSLVVVTASLFVYHRYFAPQVLVMDVSGYMQYRKAEFMKEWDDKKASDTDIKKSAAEYTRESMQVIDAAVGSARRNQIIVFKDVVVNNKNQPYVSLDPEADKWMEKIRNGK